MVVQPDRQDTDGDSPVLAWWVVANVGETTTHVRGDGEVRSGLQHFSAGAKLWVLPPQWGDGGEKVMVVGRHRGASKRGYIRAVVPRRHLTNFRVRGVYSPAVLRRLTEQITLGWPARMWEGLDQAEAVASRWNDESREGPS